MKCYVYKYVSSVHRSLTCIYMLFVMLQYIVDGTVPAAMVGTAF